MAKKRIGVLGGSFDPIHVGHLILGQRALDAFELDEVIYMPARLSPFKQLKTKISGQDRLKMAELAVADNAQFSVSDLEMHRPEPSYTIDTIHLLKERYPGVEIYFIAGSDSIFQLEKWMTFEALLKEVIFVGAHRSMHTTKELEDEIVRLNDLYQADVRLLDFPFVDISSTYIREQLLAGHSIRYLVTDPVITYIKEKGLYLEEKRD